MRRHILNLAIAVFLLTGTVTAFSQEAIIQKLDESPRHHEWINVKSGERTVRSFVAYPQVSEPALTVVVIHENKGLTDWVRYFADQLAAQGYLAVAPDLLSDYDEEHQSTSNFPSEDAARQAIYALNPDQVTQDLKTVQAFVSQLSASNGDVAVIGFCWGGAQSFRYATNTDKIKAALVFYGTPPDSRADLERIQVPVYGFYGSEDERVTGTVPTTAAMMETMGKPFEYEIYEGATHAFMRKGDLLNGSKEDIAARDAAWERITRILLEMAEQ